MENLMYWEDDNLRGKYHPPDCKTIKLKVILDTAIFHSQSKLPFFSSQVFLNSIYFCAPGWPLP